MDPYVGEIRTIGFSYAPAGWAMCNGQILPIAQNTPLFSLLGAQYGGNGTTTFALPNLNGAMVIGPGQGPGLTPRDIGEIGGSRVVTLTTAEMPRHTHAARGSSATGTTGNAPGSTWAQPRLGRAPRPAYAAPGASVDMAPLAPAGGGASHNNLPPFLAMYFVIALQGVFPPRP